MRTRTRTRQPRVTPAAEATYLASVDVDALRPTPRPARPVPPHAGYLLPETFGHFAVTIVQPGERYGLDNKLTWDGTEPMVEFYDTRYKHTTAGQYVNRYNISTLRKHSGGLCLWGTEPSWSIDAATFEAVRVAVEKVLSP